MQWNVAAFPHGKFDVPRIARRVALRFLLLLLALGQGLLSLARGGGGEGVDAAVGPVRFRRVVEVPAG